MGKGLEIVFASSDKDQAAFDEYYAEMPWLALPYSERSLKETLSKKYKVRGIPSFVVLDDANGEELPWKPKALKELLEEMSFVNKEGESTKLGDISKPYVGLYFSAHWCPPCRGFTPELAKRYTKLNENGLE